VTHRPADDCVPWWDNAWWAEPLDHAELRRRGFTYQEVRELERLRMEAIPAEVTEATRASLREASARFVAFLEELKRRALEDEDDG
jgi:hypothetical protein